MLLLSLHSYSHLINEDEIKENIIQTIEINSIKEEIGEGASIAFSNPKLNP